MFALELEGWADWSGPWTFFSHLATPTLILVGAKEDPQGDCYQAAQRMRQGQAHVLQGVGHVGAFLASATAVRHARSFLSEFQGATS